MMSQNSDIKLASWNLCLGLANKKEVVSRTILEKKIDICVMQEIDIHPDYNTDLLTFRGYGLITESIFLTH